MATILVTDDEALIRLTIRKMLEKEGHRVLEASDGKQAEAIAAEIKVDLLITDIIMPEQEGIETIMSIRKTQSELPILAISGGGRNANLDYLVTAELLGANATLCKPFDKDALIEVVNTLLQPA